MRPSVTSWRGRGQMTTMRSVLVVTDVLTASITDPNPADYSDARM